MVYIKGEKIFQLNIKPYEAQELITQQNHDLQYGVKMLSEDKINQSNRTEDELNTNVDLKKYNLYKINYKHGQDGLGGYYFSYSDWNQARMEARNTKGEIRGRYKYKYNENDNKEYTINYWADELGFHYEDNLPKIQLIPVTEEPSVKKAREEHLQKWKEAAEQAKKIYDPMSDYYNRFAIQYDEQQALLEQEKEIFNENGFNLRSLKKLKTLTSDNGRKFDKSNEQFKLNEKSNEQIKSIEQFKTNEKTKSNGQTEFNGKTKSNVQNKSNRKTKPNLQIKTNEQPQSNVRTKSSEQLELSDQIESIYNNGIGFITGNSYSVPIALKRNRN